VPLLLLHGGPGVPHDYLEPLAAELAKDRRVIMFDQLGCGLSDMPQDPANWTVKHYLHELVELIDILELKEVIILGQSWGGMLAMEYAVAAPENLVGLILSNSLASSETWNRETRRLVAELPVEMRRAVDKAEKDGDTSGVAFQKATMEFYSRHVCRLPEWPECLRRSFTKLGEHPEVYRHMWGASEFYCDGTLREWDIRSRLGRIEAPTMLISGEYDEATPAVQKEMLEGISGSAWQVLPGASHMAHLEKSQEYLGSVRHHLEMIDRSIGRRC
jgi:proline-specific peptidase